MACLWRQLPEDCVSRILSGTSPADVCRTLTVSKEFRHPAESNLVWNQFLPSDIHTILPSPINFSSTKDLFFLLSQSMLVDDGKKVIILIPYFPSPLYSNKYYSTNIDMIISWCSHLH